MKKTVQRCCYPVATPQSGAAACHCGGPPFPCEKPCVDGTDMCEEHAMDARCVWCRRRMQQQYPCDCKQRVEAATGLGEALEAAGAILPGLIQHRHYR